MTQLCDAVDRRRALDPEISCIVRAPAGSGKTELLIQRYLLMLARVENPGEVLAITFTRKAAAEMRERIVAALKRAQSPPAPDESAHQQTTRTLAHAVLKRDKSLCWNLLYAPAQLRIQTIDSFNAQLVRRMPWLSRMGALPSISAFPQQHYTTAVRNLLFKNQQEPHIRTAFQSVMEHLDNRADILETMLLDMLQSRDQWMRHFMDNPEQMRASLERSLQDRIEQILKLAHQGLSGACAQQLHELATFAAAHCARDQSHICQYTAPAFPAPEAGSLVQWRAVATMLLTTTGQWRKRLDKNCGFPTGTPELKARKAEATELLEHLRDTADPRIWDEILKLPQPFYTDRAWEVLNSLLTLLPRLVAQLWVEFHNSGEADFTEIALCARQALVDSGNPTDLLLNLDQHIQHILVDEFQDTSWLQFSLLETLTSGWEEGMGRTLFIVGDPMQSIYRFREAEVGLFLRASAAGIGNIRLVPLQLKANFRSQADLISWINRWFARIFPASEDPSSGAVAYAPSTSVHPGLGSGVTITAMPDSDLEREAEQVVATIQQLLQTHTSDTVAVLVRSRSHLRGIIAALRGNGIAYQAQDIDPLASRPIVRDYLSLIKTLLHPGDKLSWMSVLHAPWCGLSMADLTCMADYSTLEEALCSADIADALCAEACRRLQHVGTIVCRYQRVRGTTAVRALAEECLHAIGGCCCSAADLEAIEQVGAVLDQCECGGDIVDFNLLHAQVDQLYASCVNVDARVHVMTIHKAKGLEFDHVILPGLGRKPRRGSKRLLRWQEDADLGLLLAPVSQRNATEPDPVYAMLERLENSREGYETARLLYVAVTRARKHLYCYAHAPLDAGGQPRPISASLLQLLWPACDAAFAALEDVPATDTPVPEQSRCACKLKRLPLSCFAQESLSTPDISGAERGKHKYVIHDADTMKKAVIGTVVHEFLAYLCEHPESCHEAGIQQLREPVCRRLFSAGYGEKSLQMWAAVQDMLLMTISSEKGQWLLADHPEARVEFELCGFIENNCVTGIIDRTFIDSDTGERWIIDYKSANPDPGEDLHAFYSRQRLAYTQQLTRYRQLMLAMEPERACRTALFFPAFAGWCEL